MPEGRHDDLLERAIAAARSVAGSDWTPDRISVAPGRIELIGNHIDYNGGPVLAGAIDRVIVVAVGPAITEGHLTVLAPDLGATSDSFDPGSLRDWRASAEDEGPGVYVRGIIAALDVRDIPCLSEATLAMAGDIPPGFGMSSSAALCLATVLALTDADIAPSEMVAIAREAEHRAGSPVGAMDQSASVAGGVILFDGRDATFTAMQPELGDLVFAVADSGVDRALRTSSYAARVEESESARKIIESVLGRDIPALADVSMDEWRGSGPHLHQQLGPLYRRARHVVTETERVREALTAVEASDWKAFGKLMNASGDSSARDYEISHPSVEELVLELRQMDGVLGARMMGGGEGGPALALLHGDAVEHVTSALNRGYYSRHVMAGSGPYMQVCVFGHGAHRLTER